MILVDIIYVLGCNYKWGKSVDAERVLTGLQRGMNQISQMWESFDGEKHHRVDEILSTQGALGWGISDDGIRWHHHHGPVDASIRVVVVRDIPSADVHLQPFARFQTWPELWGDETPTVYVKRDSYTSLWADLVLCHELDHALEYRDGDSHPGESDTIWDEAEGRAHRNEADLVNPISSGKFINEAMGIGFEQVISRDPAALANDLMQTIPARLRQPHQSEAERGPSARVSSDVRSTHRG